MDQSNVKNNAKIIGFRCQRYSTPKLYHKLSLAAADAKSTKRKSNEDLHDAPPHYHIKQTTCPACMEKWRTPLPSPKTPRVKRSSLLPTDENSHLKTNAHNRISMLINKEKYKLESYDRKYSTDSESTKRFTMKKKETEKDLLDNVNLHPMDLAKIEQEIKERETRKKLERFLKE